MRFAVGSRASHPSTYIEPAVQGTRRALAAARKAGVERVVVTSSVVASTRTVPDSLVRIIGLFERDVRGLVKYLGKRVGADNAATLRDLDWTPIPFDKTVLDTAASLKSVVEA